MKRFTLHTAFSALLIFLIVYCSLGIDYAHAQSFWQQTNGPYGGTVNALAINSGGQIFAGTDGGGVYRSADNGGSWAQVNTGLTNTSVYTLAINSSGAAPYTGHIFAGTNGGGVYRSTDNGGSWTQVNTGLTNTSVYALAINSSGHIFAGTNGGGVYRSTDNGGSWTQVNAGVSNTYVRALAINSSGHIFAGIYFGGGIYRSTDNGGSWTQVNTGLTSTTVRALVINLSGQIFAGTDGGGGVFRSTDNGGSWTQVNIGLPNTDVRALTINLSGHIFAGTTANNVEGVYRSTDNGGSWTQVNTFQGTDVRALAINLSGHIFAGTTMDRRDGGVYRSTDNGESWTQINIGLTSSFVNALAINSNGHIFAGTQGSGVYRSTDNGANWSGVGTGLSGSQFMSLAINSSGQIFVSNYGSVFRSMDNGGSWTQVNTGLPNTDVWSLAINSSGQIFAGTNGGGVFRSTDNGSSWTRVNTGLTSTSVRALAINLSGQIFAGTNGGGVFRSTDNGSSWTQVNTNLTSTSVRALAINSSGPAPYTGHFFAGTAGGVFRSTDNSGSWTQVNTGLSNTDVWSLAINSSGHIFAGTNSGGVFRSTDNGGNWTQVNTGLTSITTTVWSLAINSSGSAPYTGYIFAGTGAGIFRSVQSTTQGVATVTTNAASNVNSTFATLNGTVNPNGASTTAYFEWDTNSSLVTSTSTASQTIGSGTSAVSVTANLTALSANTTYYFRTVGQNSSGTQKGSIVSFTTSAIVTPSGEYIADANTVLLLHMNETSGSTVSDASGQNNNGTATGTTIVNGRFGKARQFAPNEFVNVAPSASLSFSSDFTIETWLKTSTLGPTDPQVFIYKWDGQNEAGIPGLKVYTDYPSGHFGLGFNDGNGLPDNIQSVSRVDDGRWHHVAVSRGGNTILVFVDGALERSKISAKGSLANASPLQLGNSNRPLDEVRISNIARSPSEFNLQLPPKNLSATSAGSAVINLSWQNGGGTVPLMRYKIYSGTDSTAAVLIDSTASTSYSNSGLIEGLRYFYRVSAVDSTGFEGAKSYSANAVPGLTPTATTTAATNVGLTSATLNGSVNPNGLATNAYFEWGTSSTLTTFSATTSQSIGSGGSAVAVSANVTGLLPNTTYFYRVLGQNVVGTQRGSIQSFTAGGAAPTVTTSAASSVTSSSAILNGSVNPNGLATTTYFEWGTSSTLATSTATSSQSVGSATSAVSVTANLTALSPSTTYYYRAVGQNSAGTNRGSIVSVTTTTASASAPSVTTGSATNITSTSAVFNGIVIPNGLSTTGVFQYGTSTSYGNSVSAAPSPISGTNGLAVSAAVTLLSPNTLYHYRLVATNSIGTATGGDQPFTTVVAAPTTPVLSSPSNGAVNQPTTLTLSWQASSDATSYRVQVCTDYNFNSIVFEDSSATGTSKQIGPLASNTDYYWHVRAWNISGFSAYSEIFYFKTISTAQLSNVVPFPSSPTSSTDYRLFSLPGTTSLTVGDILSGTQKIDWRVFRDNGDLTDYLIELSSSYLLNSGQGYWLLKKGGLNITRTMVMPQLSSEGTYSVPLTPGWNIIGNPFDRSVQWSAVQSANGLFSSLQPQAYTGTYVSSSTIEPFSGYYFDNRTASLTQLKIPYPFPSLKIVTPEPPRIDWKVQLGFESDINADRENYIGIAPSSAVERDVMDIRKPPLFLDQGFLYFDRPGWDNEYHRFAGDFRPTLGDGQVWDFEVSNPRMSQAKIAVKGIEQIPAEYDVTLLNLANSVPVNLRVASEYSYKTVSEKMQFKLIVGKHSFAEQELLKFVPLVFELEQNYPNPFNPSTSITFKASRSSSVRLEVYSLLGQRIAMLVDKVLAAGVHTVVWNATDESGVPVTSGVYIYKITADSFAASKKMVLLR